MPHHPYPWRAGTLGVSTATFICLAVLCNQVMRSDAPYAVLLAAAVACSAGSCLLWLRRWRIYDTQQLRARVGQALSALGGLTVLVVGMILAIATQSSAQVVQETALQAITQAMPIAVVFSFCGGLLLLPNRSAAAVVGVTVVTTLAATWLAINREPNLLMIGVAATSLAGASVALVASVRARVWLAAVAAFLVGVHVAGYFVLALGVISALSLRLVAWAILIAAGCAAVAGIGTGATHRLSSSEASEQGV